MSRIPMSESTRVRAMHAYANMDTEKLVELLNQAPKSYVPDYYKQSIAESMQYDAKRAREWLDVKDMMNGVTHSGAEAPKKMLAAAMRETRPTLEQGPRTTSVKQGMALPAAKAPSALSQGDNLRVAQPKLTLDMRKKADEALHDLAPNTDTSNNDSGGAGGYGF